MKIRLTDNRGIWLDGEARYDGYEATVEDEAGQTLIDAGMAKQVHTRAKRSKAEEDDAVAE
jgi:hypothetical protein